jgi:hypothetical protein
MICTSYLTAILDQYEEYLMQVVLHQAALPVEKTSAQLLCPSDLES